MRVSKVMRRKIRQGDFEHKRIVIAFYNYSEEYVGTVLSMSAYLSSLDPCHQPLVSGIQLSKFILTVIIKYAN